MMMAQILRTYDSPQIKDIKKIYLQNIKKTTSYIYTENQYFRWPPLAEAFIETWKQLRKKGRPADMPIYWFAITNSSDDGMGKGTERTNAMLEKLGRQDVMPNVALNREKRKAELTRLVSHPTRVLPETLKKWKQELDELNAKPYTKTGEELRNSDIFKRLKKEVGIKAHICTLTASNAWKEVYIHSKVTIIDDVFTIISSANINSRSMEDDTELGIITEHGATARKLRQDLWKLHTRSLVAGNNDLAKLSREANPADMHNPKVAKIVFEKWQELMKENKDQIIEGNKQPLSPLCELLRLDPTISRMD